MARSKDFIYMDILDIKGKRLGFIEDIIIDFNNNKVTGFKISSLKIKKEYKAVLIDDIISFSDAMIVNKLSKGIYFTFKGMKNFDVIDTDGKIIGVCEDIIFEKDSFIIKAVVMSTGILSDIKYGKRILLCKDIILGEENLFYKCNKDFELFSKIHSIKEREYVKENI